MSNEIQNQIELDNSDTAESQNGWQVAAQDAYAPEQRSATASKDALATDNQFLTVHPIRDLSGNVIPDGPPLPSESTLRDRAVNALYRPQSFDPTTNDLTPGAVSSVSEYFNRPVSTWLSGNRQPTRADFESRATEMVLRYARSSAGPGVSIRAFNENGVIVAKQWDDQRREYRSSGGLGFRINSDGTSIDIVHSENPARVVGTVQTRR